MKLAGRVYVVERLGRELEVTVKIGENLIAVVTGKGSRSGRAGNDLLLNLEVALVRRRRAGV